MPIKHQKHKKNTKGKIDPQIYVLQGSPPVMAIKTQKNTIKKGKTDPLKYVYQGSPL